MKTSSTQPVSFSRFSHGGDYNPDQWLEENPEIMEEDIRLMHLAGCNTFSIGIFSWDRYEPREGEYHFDWMDRILDRLARENFDVLLATPSAGKPDWLSRNYPETTGQNAHGQRLIEKGRMNHCFSSPVFREKITALNRQLGARYQNHPALRLWHISNEYHGECHCEHCQKAFINWLKKRYGSLEALNQAWWSSFWGHRVIAWEDITSTRTAGGDGKNLDWKRFVTFQTVDFMKTEIAALRLGGAAQPVTTNMMGIWPTNDFHKYSEVVDIIADDCYPAWKDRDDDWKTAAEISCVHDVHRSMKGGRPWMLLESCPDSPNWLSPPKLKRPGMTRTEMLLAVAHGADAVMYFQWRKGRGGGEKFHGAVVDHYAGEENRVFQEVADLGVTLQKLNPLLGSRTPVETAFIFDWEARWALQCSSGPPKGTEQNDLYSQTLFAHYRPYWSAGIPAEVIESQADFSPYRLLIAPRLYLLKKGVAGAMKAFVEQGGTLLLTPYSGVVDESNRCFTGGWPGDGLMELCGIRVEEVDRLLPDDLQEIWVDHESVPELKGRWRTGDVCELIHAEGAEVLGSYGQDFYQNRPALTRNRFGKGTVYYLAAETEDNFLDSFHIHLQNSLQLRKTIETILPKGVTATFRSNGTQEWIFLQNFNPRPARVDLKSGCFTCLESGEELQQEIHLNPRETRILLRAALRQA